MTRHSIGPWTLCRAYLLVSILLLSVQANKGPLSAFAESARNTSLNLTNETGGPLNETASAPPEDGPLFHKREHLDPVYHNVSGIAIENVEICKSRPFALTQENYLRSGADEWLRNYTMNNQNRRYMQQHGIISTIAYDFLGDTNFKCAIGFEHLCNVQCLTVVTHVEDLRLARQVYFALASASHFISALSVVHDALVAAQSTSGLLAGKMATTFFFTTPSADEELRARSYQMLMEGTLWAAQTALNSLLPMIPWSQFNQFASEKIKALQKQKARPDSEEDEPTIYAPFDVFRYWENGGETTRYWTTNAKTVPEIFKSENMREIFVEEGISQEDAMHYVGKSKPIPSADLWQITQHLAKEAHDRVDPEYRVDDPGEEAEQGKRKKHSHQDDMKEYREWERKKKNQLFDEIMGVEPLKIGVPDCYRFNANRVADAKKELEKEKKGKKVMWGLWEKIWKKGKKGKKGKESQNVESVQEEQEDRYYDPRIKSLGPVDKVPYERVRGTAFNDFKMDLAGLLQPVLDNDFVSEEERRRRLSWQEKVTRAENMMRDFYPSWQTGVVNAMIKPMFSTWEANDPSKEHNEMSLHYLIQESSTLARKALKQTANRVFGPPNPGSDGDSDIANLMAAGSLLPVIGGLITKTVIARAINAALRSQKVYVSCTQDLLHFKTKKSPGIQVDKCEQDNSGPQNLKACIGGVACYIYRWNDRPLIMGHHNEEPFGLDVLARPPWDIDVQDVIISSFFSKTNKKENSQLGDDNASFITNSGPNAATALDTFAPGVFTIPVCLAPKNWNTRTKDYWIGNDINPYATVKALPCYCGALGEDTSKIWHDTGLMDSGAQHTYTHKNCPNQFKKRLSDWLERYVAMCNMNIHKAKVGGKIKSGKHRFCDIVVQELKNKGVQTVTELDKEVRYALKCKIKRKKKSKGCKKYYRTPVSSVWDETEPVTLKRVEEERRQKSTERTVDGFTQEELRDWEWELIERRFKGFSDKEDESEGEGEGRDNDEGFDNEEVDWDEEVSQVNV